jgi:hypothetical protein
MIGSRQWLPGALLAAAVTGMAGDSSMCGVCASRKAKVQCIVMVPPELNLSNVICGFPLFPDFYLEIDLEVKA